MVSKVRAQRIADRIREELSEILLMESSDPRLSGIQVTDVEVDRELDYANIYVSSLEGSERAKEILQALGHARGFLRSELAHRIELRSFPNLRFHWDPTEERAEHMEHLFSELALEEKAGSTDDEPEAEKEDSSSEQAEEPPSNE